MNFYFTIGNQEFVCDFSAKVTFEGCKPTGPSYASGGDPGAGPEFEITIERIYADYGGETSLPLEIPQWLRETLEEEIQGNDLFAEKILKDHFDRKQDDADRAHEARMEFMREEAAYERSRQYNPILYD